MATSTTDEQGVDEAERLGAWMDSEGLPGAGEPVVLTPLTGGSQNALFAMQRGDERMVLRRPSHNAMAGRAEGMVREHRLVRALRDTDVPHARLIGGCDDADVLGAPFFLMEEVDGWCPTQAGPWPAPFDTDLGARAGLGIQLVDGIAKLARVDWQARGLEGFGHPDGFHDRQVDRWLKHLATFKLRELPGIDVAAAWLRSHRPRTWSPGIMHGDYQFANVMFAHGAPARLAAIIDWEMATVGDPLLDLGWALLAWPPEGDDMNMRYVDYEGMPSRDELLEHYATVSGRPVDDIDYYVILARFKLAIVLEASVSRLTKGEADDRVVAFAPIVLELMRKAAQLAQTTTL